MLLFQKRFHAGLLDGSVTVTFRRWASVRVRVGGRYRCHPIGVLEVDAITQIRVGHITADDARRSGFDTREALLEYMASGPGGAIDDDSAVYRVELRHGGDGDRVEIAQDAALTPEDVAELRARLARLDARGAWTAKTLRAIDAQPRVAASVLAKKLRRETLPFKVDVRKLKKLGLTQSFEVGYEISPRGRAYLEAVAQPKKKAKAPAKKKAKLTRSDKAPARPRRTPASRTPR